MLAVLGMILGLQSDDDRLDLLGDEDVLGEGLQWHLHEEEQTEEESVSGILVTPGGISISQGGDEGTLVTPGGSTGSKGSDHLLLGGLKILKGVVTTKWLYR